MPFGFKKYRQVLFYGLAFAILVSIVKLLEIRYVLLQNSLEMYGGGIALIFTALGIWLAFKLNKSKVKTVIIEKQFLINNTEKFVFNEQAFLSFGLSKRELEVLQLMAIGLSNQEIADSLFVSLNTIKTHVSKLFEKLDVKRRTQAIEFAKKERLIA